MEIKKEYTLEEISKWLSEINYPKKVRTLREWFKDIQPSNGISRPSKYDYDTVISIIKEKINNNKSKKETLKEMIKKDEDEIFNSLKRQEEEGYIYPGEAIDLFYQNDISNWEEDAYKKAEEYAEKKQQNIINTLIIKLLIRELGYSLQEEKIHNDLVNSYLYGMTYRKFDSNEYVDPRIPIMKKSQIDIHKLDIDTYFTKTKNR